MKIKLLKDICGPEGNYKTGEVVELSDKLTTALIQDGNATLIESKIEVIEIKEVEKINIENKMETFEEIKPFKINKKKG